MVVHGSYLELQCYDVAERCAFLLLCSLWSLGMMLYQLIAARFPFW
jgi:hypothetical protein